MKSQINVSTIVDAVYQTVFDLTADIHQARWDAYWTLTSLIYPGIDEAPEQDQNVPGSECRLLVI